jgi:hypothetical protein
MWLDMSLDKSPETEGRRIKGCGSKMDYICEVKRWEKEEKNGTSDR